MVLFKRIVPLVLVAFVLIPVICLFAPTASAEGVGIAINYYASIPFDEIRFGSQYINSVTFDGAITAASTSSIVTNSSIGCTQVVAGPNVGPQIYPNTAVANTEVRISRDYNSIRLIARDFIIDMELFEHFYVGLTEEYSSGTAEVDIKIRRPVEQNDSYVIRNFVASGTYQIEAGELPDIADYIKARIAIYDPHRYVYIDELKLTLTSSSDVPDGYFDLQYSSVKGTLDMSAWFNQYNLVHLTENIIQVDPANPDDVSFVDWLRVAVSSFLDFELWNGFTLNQLIEFVVVIGLLFWFITLLI